MPDINNLFLVITSNYYFVKLSVCFEALCVIANVLNVK